MDKAKQQRLEAKGWTIGSGEDFLDLSPEESTSIELKLALSAHVKQCRQRRKLTQKELARLIQSSQSRVAKMEAGDPSVSLDLLIRTLLVLGASPQDLAKMIVPSRRSLAS